MLIENVAKLSPKERFLYWCLERHCVYLKRQAGEPPPWTDDEVLQNNFFTNPYRENDKVTVWFRENIRGPLRDNPDVLFATILFRWFNWPETGQLLIDNGPGEFGYLTKWDAKGAQQCLDSAFQEGRKVFTGAYMIKAEDGPPGSKIGSVCRHVNIIWPHRMKLVEVCLKENTMESLHKELMKFKYLGGFNSYEIVCDLRYTYLLENATDKMTFSNLGPGAARGLNRLLERKVEKKFRGDWLAEFKIMLEYVNERLPADMPEFEMREVEMVFCEYDKFERIRLGDGRSKRKYNGSGK